MKLSEKEKFFEHESIYCTIIDKLTVIWKEVLEIPNVGIDDNFLELGGHSIKAIALEVRIYKEFNVELSLEDIFQDITIRKIADKISGLQNKEYKSFKHVENKEYYSLSSIQKRILMLNQMSEVGTSYNIISTYLIEGRLDLQLMEHSFNNVVNRHNALKLCIKSIGGEYVQYINNETSYNMAIINSTEDKVDEEIKNIIKPFDLFRGPLVRATMIQFAEERYIFVLDIHHIISDGTSVAIILDELFSLYNGQTLNKAEFQYTDYITWQSKDDSANSLIERENYWLNEFTGKIPLLDLPTDFPRLSYRMLEGDIYSYTLDVELVNNLRKLALEHKVTLYNIVLSIYSILLSKCSGQDDVIIGTVMASRTRYEYEKIVGPFINNVAIRCKINNNLSFIEYIEVIKNKITNAFINQPYPIEQLTEKLDLELDISRNVLFDTMLIFQNYKKGTLNVKNSTIRFYPVPHNTSPYDITVYVDEEESGKLTLSFEYSTKLFRRDTIIKYSSYFENLAFDVIKEPQKKIHNIQILSQADKNQLLYRFNSNKVSYPNNIGIKELFEEQVIRKPNSTAIIYNSSSLTYSELNKKANQLARKLQSLGVGRNSMVSILVERSLYMIIGILGTIKAGAAYNPIDPDYPSERVDYILSNSDCDVLLTQKHIMASINFSNKKIDIENKEIYTGEDSNTAYEYRPDDLAYIIYTSGSTGNPKGVMITHRSLTNAAYMWRDVYNLNTFDINLLQIASISFDMFTGDLVRSLSNGGKMVICPNESKYNIPSLYKLINEYSISIFETTPTIALTLMNYINEENLNIESLKILILGGDSFPIEEYKKILNWYGNKIRIINNYGVTEATIDSSMYENTLDNISTSGNTPIGRPLPNTEYLILDPHLQLQPIGVIGELYIGGVGVGKGYYRNEELTNERFIQNPFNSKEIIYKTGDLVRWNSNGIVEYIGRLDNQVKIRGHRIELGEIENQMLKSGLIDEIIVTVNRDSSGISYLTAYIVSTQDLTLDLIREKMKDVLPEYMIPTYFIKVEEIPLTPNGKINRKMLPDPTASNLLKSEYIEPRNECEYTLVNIWRDVLNIQDIGIYNSFLSLGGHSLKAMNLATKIYKEFNIEILLSDIYKLSNIKRMAEFILGSERVKYTALATTPKSNYYPLSIAQKGIFVLNQSEDTNTTYNIPYIRIIEGSIDVLRLERIFNILIERHEPLRTSFEIIDGQPVQRVHEKVDFKINYSEIEEQNIYSEITNFVRPFNLGQAPLIRVALYKIDDTKHVFLLDIHHIIADGSSINILIKEISDLYNNKELYEVNLQYKDYAVWQNNLYNEGYYLAKQSYWFEKLSGDIPILNLPYDNTKTRDTEYVGDNIYLNLSTERCKRLLDLANRQNVTLHSILFATFTLLLSKYSGQEDIIVGSISAGRKNYELQSMVGVFINVIPIRIMVDSNNKYTELITNTNETIISASDNQEYTISEIVQNLPNLSNEYRYSSGTLYSTNPLFNTMFIFHNYIEDEFDLSFDNCKCKNTKYKKNDSYMDIELEIVPSIDNSLFCMFEYNSILFKKETVQRMVDSFEQIVDYIIDNPTTRLSDISILSKKEESKILCEFNNNKHEYSKFKPLHVAFEEQVEKTPNQIAVRHGNIQLTYAELNEKSNQLARYLKKLGSEKEELVVILLDRSTDTLISILAVWKAGAAYMPLDPQFPNDRISNMLEDSCTKFIITKAEHIKQEWANEYSGVIIKMDTAIIDINSESRLNLNEKVGINDLAYVLYTSGSTGKPKGVMIEHLGLMNHIQIMIDEFNINLETNIAQNAPFCFDISVWQFVTSLTVGAKCIIYPDEMIMNPREFINQLIKDEISILEVVPSFLSILLDYLENSDCKFGNIRKLIVTGEPVKLNLIQRWFSRVKGIEIVNAYGPAEASDDVTFYSIDDSKDIDRILIGKPLKNINIYIVDKNMKLCPIGLYGEICISGISVGRGYLNDPEKTQKTFLKDPFINGQEVRLYKTGDIGRWLDDGNIEYLGRVDYQVKISGFRIELGEIENILGDYEGIHEATVIDRENDRGEKCICAYYTSPNRIDNNIVREYLCTKLPAYMIPSYFEQLDKMPLLPNGKTNRKYLKTLQLKSIEKSISRMPENNTEQHLLDIWNSILNIDNIGVDDNFFMLGGNSLKAIILVYRIQNEIKKEVPISIIFKSPTIKEIAAFVLETQEKDLASIQVALKKELYDISSAQKRIYVSSKLEGNGIHYNIPLVYRIENNLDLTKVKHTITKLIQRHESLRTTFVERDNKVYQRILNDIDPEIEFWEVEDENKAEQIIKSFIRPFDLAKGPLFRIGIIKITETINILLFDIHHIITDAQSNMILIKDFFKIYDGKELQTLKIQYKDYSEWQNDLIASNYFDKEERFWTSIFSKISSPLELPLDFERPPVQIFDGSKVYCVINEELTLKLQNICNSEGVTFYMLLLSAYNVLLAYYACQDDIIVGTPITGRIHPDIENVVGMFVNTIAIRSFPENTKLFLAYLKEIKQKMLDSYDNKNYQFDILVEKLKLIRKPNRNPLFDVAFAYLDISSDESYSDNFIVTEYINNSNTSKFDITLNVTKNNSQIFLEYEYCTKLFKENTIQKFSEHYLKILNAIVDNLNVRIGDIELEEFNTLNSDIGEIEFNFDYGL